MNSRIAATILALYTINTLAAPPAYSTVDDAPCDTDIGYEPASNEYHHTPEGEYEAKPTSYIPIDDHTDGGEPCEETLPAEAHDYMNGDEHDGGDYEHEHYEWEGEGQELPTYQEAPHPGSPHYELPIMGYESPAHENDYPPQEHPSPAYESPEIAPDCAYTATTIILTHSTVDNDGHPTEVCETKTQYHYAEYTFPTDAVYHEVDGKENMVYTKTITVEDHYGHAAPTHVTVTDIYENGSFYEKFCSTTTHTIHDNEHSYPTTETVDYFLNEGKWYPAQVSCEPEELYPTTSPDSTNPKGHAEIPYTEGHPTTYPDMEGHESPANDNNYPAEAEHQIPMVDSYYPSEPYTGEEDDDDECDEEFLPAHGEYHEKHHSEEPYTESEDCEEVEEHVEDHTAYPTEYVEEHVGDHTTYLTEYVEEHVEDHTTYPTEYVEEHVEDHTTYPTEYVEEHVEDHTTYPTEYVAEHVEDHTTYPSKYIEGDADYSEECEEDIIAM